MSAASQPIERGPTATELHRRALTEAACSHKAAHLWATAGRLPEGELRVCLTCGQGFVHVVDESEGCWWEPIDQPPGGWSRIRDEHGQTAITAHR